MESEVIIVGAGPVGLMLAGELRLAGTAVVICEQRDSASGESRGVGFTRRAAETFDQRGLLSRLGDFEIGNEVHFGGIRIDSRILDDNHFGVRGVPQYRIEEMLERWALGLGAQLLRGQEVRDVREVEDGVIVTVDTADGPVQHKAGYLVGCDGGRSIVRRLTGIDFPGKPATRGMYVADIVGRSIRPRVIGERVPGGMVMAVRLEDGVDRIIIHPDVLPPRDPSTLTFTEIADSWQSLTGESLHTAEVRWISAFTDATRQAAEYRRGRILLAGDATHIHIPAGAQGLSVGIQDAANLGWKLAATVRGTAPQGLLDSYHTERHPVGARVLNNTLAQSLLYLTGDEMEPMRSVMRELVTHPEAACTLAGKVSGLDIRYDMQLSGSPLIGRRLPPDWELLLSDGRLVRAAELLHPAHGVYLDLGAPEADQQVVAQWADRVDVISGHWAKPGQDERQAGLTALLVRPDGYIAWAAPGAGEVTTALERWFGLARTRVASSD